MSQCHAQLEKEDSKGIHTEASHAKTKLIETAKNILAESRKIIQHATPLVNHCKDKVLSKQLSSLLGRIETLSQQLKIVAAVKASNPADRDKGSQLIQCTTNLVIALKACLKSCVSASLRSSHEGIQFRKLIK
jgi:hypothetical protein